MIPAGVEIFVAVAPIDLRWVKRPRISGHPAGRLSLR